MPNDTPDWLSIAGNLSRQVGVLNNVGSGDTQTASIALPPLTQGVGFDVSAVSPNQTPGSVTIKGHQTGLAYVGVGSTVAWAAEVFPQDTSIDVTVIGNAGAFPSITYINAYTYSPRVRVGGSAPSVPITVQLGVSTSLGFAIAIGAGAQATIIAAIAAVKITLDYTLAGVDTAAATAGLAWYDGDPSAGGTQIGVQPEVTTEAKPIHWHGRSLTSGNGLFVKSDGAVGLRGTVVYTTTL